MLYFIKYGQLKPIDAVELSGSVLLNFRIFSIIVLEKLKGALL